MAIAFRDPLPRDEILKVERLALAERMHWTLAYIDSLDYAEFAEITELIQARDKAQERLSKRRSKATSAGKGKRRRRKR